MADQEKEREEYIYTKGAMENMRANPWMWRQVDRDPMPLLDAKVIPARKTDWSFDGYDEWIELYGRFDPKNGTCPTCHMLRAANGGCDCPAERKIPEYINDKPEPCADCKRYGLAPCPHNK